MTFNNPTAFYGALLAIPVIVFYLLRVRMRSVPVSTVMFWEQVIEEKQPRSLWRQLRHLISLLVQLLILSMLVFALADPVSEAELQNRRRIVVVIDTSASMQAETDDGKSRLDEAKQQLREIIQSIRPHDQLAIIVAGSQPRILCGMTSHRRQLRDHAAAINATDSPGTVSEAIALGRRLLGENRGELIALSDGCFADAVSFQQRSDIALILVGDVSNNVAVTKFQVRQSLVDLSGYQILLEVRNFSPDAAECSLELTFNDQLEDVIPLTLEPNQVWTKVIDDSATESGVLAVQLSATAPAANRLKTDDRAIVVLPERSKIPVLLVSDGNWFLEKVLEAHEAVDLRLTTDLASERRQGEIVVLHGFAGDVLPNGPAIVVSPKSSTDLWATAELTDEPLVGWQDSENRILRHVELTNVLMPRAVQISPKSEHHVLVESASGDPLLLRFPRQSGDVFVLAVDLEQGDLPLRTAFPILLGNLLNWYSGQSDDLQLALETGTRARLALRGELRADDDRPASLQLISPEGTASRVLSSNGEIQVGPLDRVGLWTLSGSSNSGSQQAPSSTAMKFACNLTNARESDLRPSVAPEQKYHQNAQTSTHRPIWLWLVALAALLLFLEWFLFQRRWIA